MVSAEMSPCSGCVAKQQRGDAAAQVRWLQLLECCDQAGFIELLLLTRGQVF
jgi:hypothetical protein